VGRALGGVEHWEGWSIGWGGALGGVEHWEGWSIGEGGGVEDWECRALGGVGVYFQSIKCLCVDVCMCMVHVCVCVCLCEWVMS